MFRNDYRLAKKIDDLISLTSSARIDRGFRRWFCRRCSEDFRRIFGNSEEKRIKIEKGGKGWLGRQIESGKGVGREDQKPGGQRKMEGGVGRGQKSQGGQKIKN